MLSARSERDYVMVAHKYCDANAYFIGIGEHSRINPLVANIPYT